jgi:hypothetical protein
LAHCSFPCFFVFSISQCFAFAFMMVHTLNMHTSVRQTNFCMCSQSCSYMIGFLYTKTFISFCIGCVPLSYFYCISQLGSRENQVVVGLYIHRCFPEFSDSKTNKLSRFSNNSNKVNFTLEQAIKAQSGSRGIALLFP